MEEKQVNVPIADAISDWMKKYKLNSVKTATYDRLETSLVMMSKYEIAQIPLETLQSSDIQSYINQLVADGYALTTIKKQFNLLSGFLRWANTEGIISRPIHSNVNLPSQSVVHKQKKEVMVYSDEEQLALRNVLLTREKPGYGAALLMMEMGFRVGEVLALNWEDVNWSRKAITVNKTLVRLANRKKSFVQQGAKSYTSNRTIPMSKVVYDLFREMRLHNLRPIGYIFTNDEGEPLSYEAMRYQIGVACEKAGVPYLGQHVFRHTFATNCFYRGCNVKILSKLLGHADVSITYNTYIHLFGDALEEMRSVVD